MKISVTNKHLESRELVQKEFDRHIAKLQRMLKRYAPDLVQLHGAFEKHPRKEEFTMALNLSLPTGTLHSVGEGFEVRSTVKQAFVELDTQLKKRQELLRKDYHRKGKREPSD
jgi:ribosome-associated translation inhibitor RaiA